MSWRTWGVLAVVVAALALPSLASPQGEVAATLSVLGGRVDRVPAGAAGHEAGLTGMDLVEGDRVRTGAGSVALITFLNGTTVTVLPESEVMVRSSAADRAAGTMKLFIHAGRVWARVVQAASARSVLTLESNDYSATARDGLIGAQRAAEGFVCWTRRGSMTIENGLGQSEAVLMAGQRAWARQGWPVTPEPFVAATSTLTVESSGPVVPLLQLPDGRVSAGFLSEDLEVNQVFGSLTSSRGRQRWVVEVPAGAAGEYPLVLTGVGAGPFTVQVSARYMGFRVSRETLTGEAHPGERLVTRITTQVQGEDPRTARIRSGTLDGLRAWEGDEPAVVVLRPAAGRGPGTN